MSATKYKIFFINDNEDGGVLIKARQHDITSTPVALVTNRQIARHGKWIDAISKLKCVEFVTTPEVASILRKGDVILVEKLS